VKQFALKRLWISLYFSLELAPEPNLATSTPVPNRYAASAEGPARVTIRVEPAKSARLNDYRCEKQGSADRRQLRDARLIHQVKASGPVSLSNPAYGIHFAAKLGQPPKLLLDLFKTLVSFSVSDLAHHVASLFAPILLIQLLNLSDFRPETHNLFLEDA